MIKAGRFRLLPNPRHTPSAHAFHAPHTNTHRAHTHQVGVGADLGRALHHAERRVRLLRDKEGLHVLLDRPGPHRVGEDVHQAPLLHRFVPHGARRALVLGQEVLWRVCGWAKGGNSAVVSMRT